MDTTRHAGKVVIVTGGASGIGAETVRRFLSEGATVVASDVNAAGLAQLLAAEGNDRLFSHVTDVASLESVIDLVESAVHTHGKLDVLVQNAGTGIAGTVEQLTEADWHRVISIDLDSVFFGAKAAIKYLRQTGGNIVNTSSISAFGANKSLSAYYAAKGGVTNFTRYLAVEHGGEGVRVNAVCPGPINSNPDKLDLSAGALGEEYNRNIPAGRVGVPSDIAAAISFLASEDAAYINGHNLVVDGGLTAWTGEPDLGAYLGR